MAQSAHIKMLCNGICMCSTQRLACFKPFSHIMHVSAVLCLILSTYFSQLFGSLGPDGSMEVWEPGILTRMLQQIAATANMLKSIRSNDPSMTHHLGVRHWLVLDGPVSDEVMDRLLCLLSQSQYLHLSCGDLLQLPGQCVALKGGVGLLQLSENFVPTVTDQKQSH